MRVAIVYQTMEGQSARIAEHIAGALRDGGAEADVFHLPQAPASLAAYDTVVVGSSVHTGKYHPDAIRFARDNRDTLNGMDSAFFSVGLTVMNPDPKWQQQAHAAVDQFLAGTGWRPGTVALFAGRLAYTKYGFVKRQLMKILARKAGGSTDTHADHEYTDWAAVDAFAREVLETVKPAAGAPVVATGS